MSAAGRASIVRRVGLTASLAVAVLAAGCGGASSSSASPGTGAGASGAAGTGAPTGSGTGTGGAAGSGSSSTGAAGTNGAAGTTVSDGGIVTGAGGSSGPQDASGSDGAADTTGAAGTNGAAGAAGAAGATGAAGTAPPPNDGGVGCKVHIDAVNPASTANLEYGPASVLTVKAWVSGYPFPPKWSWFIRSAAGSVNWTPANDAGDEVDIKLEFAGRYLIQAFIVGAPQCDSQTPPIDVGAPRTPSFLFRVTPPSGLRLPTQESLLEAPKVAAGPHTIDLGADADNPANVVSLSPSDTRGFPLPSYVRISGLSFGFDVDGYTGHGPLVASLTPGPVYNVLIVPDGGLAPVLVSSDKLDVLGQKMMAIPVGVPVSGQARDVEGQPVAGARVLLRAGERPSTLGVTGADGTFSASTREGTMSAVIAPPPGSGLPEAHVASSPGIMLLANSNDLILAMTWADPRAAPLTVTVRATDGTTVVAGAQVRAESTSEIGSVGSLHVVAPGLLPVDLPASGTARADAVSDAAGVANLGLLPAGSYRVTIAPPADAATAATTTLTVVLPETGLSRDVALLPLVVVSGTLLPAPASAGARVTAIDNGVLAPPSRAVAIADGSGKYTLMLSPGRTYELLVEPGDGSGLARDVVGRFTPGSVPKPRDVAVPVALPWKGTVVGGGRRVAGALVQVFCVASSPTCFDSSIAVAQGVTRIDGTLELALPSPTPGPAPSP